MLSAPATLPYVDADAIFAALSWAGATQALEQALADGLEPAQAADRTVVDVATGQLLLMPGETAGSVGVKLATVSPGNPARSLPRIQALYVLLDHDTLAPRALLDGTALTTLRTPAVSAVAVMHLAHPDAQHLIVFGSGPQAWGHVQALRAVRRLQSVTVVGRDPARTAGLVERIAESGLNSRVGTPESVDDADIIVCATTSTTPVFDSAALADDVCVVAVGSHDPNGRELDEALFARAANEGGVVVETTANALREAGDVILAVHAGAITEDRLTELAAVVRRNPTGSEHTPGLSVFKSVGMGWQDLVVAEAVFDRVRGRSVGRSSQ